MVRLRLRVEWRLAKWMAAAKLLSQNKYSAKSLVSTMSYAWTNTKQWKLARRGENLECGWACLVRSVIKGIEGTRIVHYLILNNCLGEKGIVARRWRPWSGPPRLPSSPDGTRPYPTPSSSYYADGWLHCRQVRALCAHSSRAGRKVARYCSIALLPLDGTTHPAAASSLDGS